MNHPFVLELPLNETLENQVLTKYRQHLLHQKRDCQKLHVLKSDEVCVGGGEHRFENIRPGLVSFSSNA